MNIIRVLFVSMTIVLTSLPVCHTAFAEALPEVVKEVKPSVVGVGFYAPLATVSHQLKGTGFVVGNGKYVVTNHHVITAFPTEENVKFHQVVFVPEGRKMGIARVKQVYKDEEHDLAILEMAHGMFLPSRRKKTTRISFIVAQLWSRFLPRLQERYPTSVHDQSRAK